jgi:hypothetical protein
MGILLDGHQRRSLCEELGLPYRVTKVSFTDWDAARTFVIQNQFARRNLTPFQRAELALKLEPLLKAAVARRADGKNPAGAFRRRMATLGRKAGVSSATLFRAKRLLAVADAETLDQLRAGRKAINTEYARRCGFKRAARGQVAHHRDALEAIRSYQAPAGESPSQTVDVLQDMAARALALGGMEPKKRQADEE